MHGDFRKYNKSELGFIMRPHPLRNWTTRILKWNQVDLILNKRLVGFPNNWTIFPEIETAFKDMKNRISQRQAIFLHTPSALIRSPSIIWQVFGFN